jgi:hypothetical protein
MEGDKYMTSKVVDDKNWMNLKEASLATGRSINSLRLLINRKKIDKVKKVRDNGPGYWLIHREAMSQISMIDMADNDTHHVVMSDTHQPIMSPSSQVISIPSEVYIQQQKEHDNLLQGMMMYRYKFEEMERQLRLLPAPVETIVPRLSELEQQAAQVPELQQTLHDREMALARAQEILTKAQGDYEQYKASIVELKEKLQEEERVKAELRHELDRERRPWWRKLFEKKQRATKFFPEKRI